MQGANAARSQLIGLATAADSAGANFGKLASIGVGALAVGLASVGIASVKMAADFQQGVTRLKTGAGDMTDNMRVLGQGILSVSTQTGILTSGTEGLNAAMYLIISSGQRGATALDTLRVAAQGAQIEQANVVDVSNALSTAMTDYGTKQFNATQFMNGFIAAVSSGKITLEQLSQAMSPILPVAQKMGVSFADVSSAMSTMTDTGMSANRAATGLRFLMQSLEVPTAKASTAFKEWGVNTQDLANEMRVSLPGALQMIYDAAKRAGPEGSQPFNAAISDMIGGQRSLQAFLDLTGIHLGQFEKNSQNVATAMGLSTTAVKGWDVAQKNFNVQMDKAHAVLDAVLIQLGTRLLPILTPMIGQIADVGAAFGKWVSNTDFSGLVETIQGIVTHLGDAWGTMQKIGGFVVNSQSWKDTATNIGLASKELGNFLSTLAKISANNPSVWRNIGEGMGQVGSAATDIIDHISLVMENLALAAAHTDKTMSTVAEAVFQMNGTVVKGALTVKDAIDLMALGYTHVKDNATGADITLKEFVRSGGLASSVSISMADALKLIGAQSGHILTAADAAKLLALGIQSVDDPAHRASIALALIATNGVVVKDGVVSMTNALKILGESSGHVLTNADAVKLLGLGVKYVNDTLRGTIDLQKAVNQTKIELQINDAQVKAAQKQAELTKARLLSLNNQVDVPVNVGHIVAGGQAADLTRKKLIAMNGPYAPVVGNGGTLAAGNTADQTRAKLLAMNGPFSPNVNASSVLAAGNTADQTRARLLALNGASTWNATVNTYQNTYIATIGGPGSGPGNARAAGGLITEPVVGVGLRTGQRWSFGESGDEMVVPMAAPTRAMSGGGSAVARQPISVNVYLDGAPVAKKLMPHIATAIRQATGAKF